MKPDDALAFREALEPLTLKMVVEGDETITRSLASIAISLKRLADGTAAKGVTPKMIEDGAIAFAEWSAPNWGKENWGTRQTVDDARREIVKIVLTAVLGDKNK